MLSRITLKWFVLYYPILGVILFFAGIVLMIKADAVHSYLEAQAQNEHPPPLLRTILKYYLLFTLLCFLFSFFPFSWPELLFSLWSLIFVYTTGIQLVRWPQTRKFINNFPSKMRAFVFRAGAIMLAVSPVMFLLSYLILRKIRP